MKKIILISFLFFITCSNSSDDEEKKDTENLSLDAEKVVNYKVEEVDIYKFGDGPYSLDECAEIGEALKLNLIVTTVYIIEIENWTQYINSSDNLQAVMSWDNVLGYKSIKSIKEAQSPFNNVSITSEKLLEEYFKKHLKDINKIYISKDIEPNSSLVYNFRELSIMTQGSDKEIQYIIEFNYDKENLYYLDYSYKPVINKNKSYDNIIFKLRNVKGYSDNLFIDAGADYLGKQSYHSRSEYFWNKLAYTTNLPDFPNGNYSDEWYINILDSHLNNLNEFSFFLNQFSECQGVLSLSGVKDNLLKQYEGIKNRRDEFISWTSQTPGIDYPDIDWYWSIKESLVK